MIRDELPEKFPRLFHKSPPYTIDGVQEGWSKLLHETCEAIYAQCESKDLPARMYPRVEQIKEKFGGLRFYISSVAHDGPEKFSKEILDDLDEAIYNLVGAAEKRSFTVCEECGAPGSLRQRSWLKTWCDACAKKRGE